MARTSLAVSAITQAASMEHEHDNERELVSRIRAGDVAAFERLYEEFVPGLLAFAHSQVRSRPVAEELVQELFLTLWKHRQQWVLARSLSAYLFGALRNRIISYRRTLAGQEALSRPASDDDSVFAMVPSTDRTDDLVREAELMVAIERAVASLPPRCRETFVLVRQQHMSYAEAAEVLGISVKAVEMNIVRAFAALRRSLADWRD